MQIYFAIGKKSREFKITAFANNKYIEQEYFLGYVQEVFDESKLNLYSVAAYHNLGKQFYRNYSNIFIKEDEFDKELYLSVLQEENGSGNGYSLHQTILSQKQFKDQKIVH